MSRARSARELYGGIGSSRCQSARRGDFGGADSKQAIRRRGSSTRRGEQTKFVRAANKERASCACAESSTIHSRGKRSPSRDQQQIWTPILKTRLRAEAVTTRDRDRAPRLGKRLNAAMVGSLGQLAELEQGTTRAITNSGEDQGDPVEPGKERRGEEKPRGRNALRRGFGYAQERARRWTSSRARP
ncbi:uncharacterized protein LOC100384502 [Zea mays]|jgi:hypothetical protein|uniref:Uncharacterized protein n=1 Tax=Zea mays TaxID=4577 RepID=C4IY76_MAIZE|nr:uncharacterized protein LOC100384502 [Zea mays]ACR33876.1 unknown [Zea mays]|eukprot:NP_001170499.1 uncharacterized protein LOC100384502 [Zea mays]